MLAVLPLLLVAACGGDSGGDESDADAPAASSLDGKGEVRVYEVDSGKKLAVCEGVTGPAYAVAWRPDGKAVASGGFDGKVWLHDPATGKLLREFNVAPSGTAKK